MEEEEKEEEEGLREHEAVNMVVVVRKRSEFREWYQPKNLNYLFALNVLQLGLLFKFPSFGLNTFTIHYVFQTSYREKNP